MSTADNRPGRDEPEPAPAQVREEPNPQLVEQHDEDRDPLDVAILAEHERVDDVDTDNAAPVQEGRLNPPPADEHD